MPKKGPHWESKGLLLRRGSIARSIVKRSEQKQQKQVELATGGWFDLTQAKCLCRWKSAAANIGMQEFALYKTSNGTLVFKAPVERQKLQLGVMQLPAGALYQNVRFEYREVSVPGAVAAMAWSDAARDAQRLFPSEFAEYQVRVRDEER